MPGKSLEDCKVITRTWLTDLQTTRKCLSTNTVSKMVELLSPADQQVLVRLITETVLKLCTAKESRREAVNVINGCFDNFPAAVTAVSSIFDQVLTFLTEVLEESWKHFNDGSCSLNFSHKEVVDYVHSISRVGALVLKAQRGNQPVKNASFYRLSVACSDFIFDVDDIAMDTKINMGMILWLMREISEESVEKQHGEFINTLLTTNDSFQLKFVKFVLAAAAVNLWDTSVITEEDTKKYLDFFLTLCENHGTETSLVLMVSRSLQMLSKHPQFRTDNPGRLVTCLMTLLEHSVPSVRHSARDLLQVLVRVREVQDDIQNQVLTTPPDHKSFYLGLAAMAPVQNVRSLIKNSPDLPDILMDNLTDPTSVPHVIMAIENLAINDCFLWENEKQWVDLWVMPLLRKLPVCLPIVAAQIEKLLLKLFKDKPDGIFFILEHISDKNPDSLKWLMVCFKIRNQIKGDGFRLLQSVYNIKEIEAVFKHGDDDTRLGAFSLLVDGSLNSETDLESVVSFFKYNLNNHRPATRQRVLSLFKRLIIRLCNCCKVAARSGNQDERFITFFTNLVNFCYANIFAEANFNRLNTVLNILDICRDSLSPEIAGRCGLFSQKHWQALQTALCSTYEENQIIAAELAKNFSFADTEMNEVLNLRQDFRVAFGHIQALEPPRVLLGTYTLYVLLHIPNAGQVLKLYFSDGLENPSDEPSVLLIQILARYLNLQVNDAKENAVKAARDAPMYGTMFAIRLFLRKLPEIHLEKLETKRVFVDLIDVSFKMADVVSPVVNNSSPEGHLPMDFQNIADNFSDVPNERNFEGLRGICENGVEAMIQAYKTAETAEDKLFLAENIRAHFECELETVLNRERTASLFEFGSKEWYQEVLRIGQSLAEYDCYFKCHLPRIIEEPPVTAQALLLYSWRSMKEACLFLGDFVSKIPLKKSLELELLSEESIVNIGLKLRLLLSEIKHRGAFEQAEVGLSALCRALWDCPLQSLHRLPAEWLREILDEIVRPPGEQTLKLTSTRRSAGLPFLVQAIITTQIASNYSPNSHTFNATMTVLLEIIQRPQSHIDAKLHALNIMRALFQNAQLGEFVFPFIPKAVKFAILGSRSESWSERNCSNMLFRALIVRIFGVARSKDQLSLKNKMTSTTFFQRFPELYDVLYQELARVNAESAHGVKPEPSLYLVLLLMGRLYPPSSEDLPEVNLSPFVSLMARCAANPIMRIRVYAARALVPFVPAHKMKSEIEWRMKILKRDQGVSANLRHGLLLQVIQLTAELKNSGKFDGEPFDWTLVQISLPFPVLDAVFKLALVHSNDAESAITQNLSNLVYANYSAEKGIGLDSCAATLALLTLRGENRSVDSWKELISLKDCPVKTVQNTILQYFYSVLTKQYDADFDFSLVENEATSFGVNNIPDEIWGWYLESEKGKFSLVADIQQRRLRILILSRLVQLSKIPFENKISAGLFLLSLFSNNWDCSSGDIADCLNFDMESVTLDEPLFARIVLRIESLLNDDKYCRMAVAHFFNLVFLDDVENLGIQYRKYWLTLFRLLIDEDEEVRKASLETVLQLSLKLNILTEKTNVTALAGQEVLIQCYEKKFQTNLDVNFILLAILTILPPEEDSSPTEFMEIFKKGNPNPFGETVALTALFVDAARRHLTNKFDEPLPGGNDTVIIVHNLLSPHFALNGLRMKMPKTVAEMLSELRRLEPPENADTIVFWRQIQMILNL